MPNFPSWNDLYAETPVERLPWFLPTLDPDFARALAARQLAAGRVLDIGSGPGTQAIELAAQGFDVVGSDLSAAAVAGATKRAASAGQGRVRFVQDDILKSHLEGPFEAIFDRGCFHVLPPECRSTYVRTVGHLLAPGGILFLKCFSDQQPGSEGPYRLSPADVRSAFGGALDVLSIERTVFQGNVQPNPQALLCELRRAS
ncbi:MAG TPA: class I SAM-dependent methyltransferase [Myxococcales bacterium]|nr:class I SAM-dependent methyltransferase [Myxococcales bacterium]